MSINDFDKLFREKFEEHEFAYNPMNWEKLTHALPPEKHKRRIFPWLTGIAASIALLAGASWWMQKDKTDIALTTPAPKNTITPALTIPDTPAPEEQKQAQPIAPVSQTLLTGTHHTKASVPYKPTNTTKEKETNPTPIPKPYEKNLIPFAPVPVLSQTREEIVTKGDLPKNPINTITHENIDEPVFSPQEDAYSASSRKTSVSLAGGFNYGSFNTGYGASVNARQKIGRRIFVEGDLGFMQNQEMIASTMSTDYYNMVNSGQFSGRPAKIEEKPYNIHYLQMAPSIGYQLHEHISVGIGADVQKLLDGTREDRPVVTTEQGFKLIPLWDAGVTGKAEYSISRRLKAGVLYREGINNLLQGNTNYYERRYLQVQMKLKLFGK